MALPLLSLSGGVHRGAMPYRLRLDEICSGFDCIAEKHSRVRPGLAVGHRRIGRQPCASE